MEKKEVKVVETERVPAVKPLGLHVPEGIKVRRVITRDRTGSEKLMLGITYLDPKCKGYRWQFIDRDEVYYVARGRITLRYDGKEIDAKEGDAVFLPAGPEYELDNPTSAPSMLVYVLTPPLE